MMRRHQFAAAALVLACALSVSASLAAQSPFNDAQRDYYAGRYNRAVDALSGAIVKSPEEAPLHYLLGQSYYQLGEYPRAIASLERAVQLSPNNSEYHDWLGKAYGRKAEQSVFFGAMSWARKAHHEFEDAVRLDPNNFQAQRDLIRYEINAPGIVGGGDEKAQKRIADLEKLDSLEGQLAQGEFFSTKKRFPEADAVFQKILESNTDRAGVFFEVSDYYRDRQNVEKMAEAINHAERVSPEDRRLKFYRGALLIMKGQNTAEAETLLKSYLSTVPENSELPSHSAAWEWLGKLYESEGRFSEAAEGYRQSLSLDPHNKAVEEDLKRVKEK